LVGLQTNMAGAIPNKIKSVNFYESVIFDVYYSATP